MTAYNVADYIGAAIESALAQCFCDFELIIVDDGSTDSTLQVAGQISDARVHVVRSAHRGAAVQLREGIGLLMRIKAPSVPIRLGNGMK